MTDKTINSTLAVTTEGDFEIIAELEKDSSTKDVKITVRTKESLKK